MACGVYYILMNNATAAQKTEETKIARMLRELASDMADLVVSGGVRQNLALTGWVQCDGYGAEGFRKAGSKPCAWQGFTQ